MHCLQLLAHLAHLMRSRAIYCHMRVNTMHTIFTLDWGPSLQSLYVTHKHTRYVGYLFPFIQWPLRLFNESWKKGAHQARAGEWRVPCPFIIQKSRFIKMATEFAYYHLRQLSTGDCINPWLCFKLPGPPQLKVTRRIKRAAGMGSHAGVPIIGDISWSVITLPTWQCSGVTAAPVCILPRLYSITTPPPITSFEIGLDKRFQFPVFGVSECNGRLYVIGFDDL
jgi:hypothetical protein